jgi:hypothetical protein
VSAEYDRGYADGRASRDEEFEGLQRQCDYWYFRALNPAAPSPEAKMVNSIIDGMEVNERWAKKRAEMDAEEQERFERAKALIGDGLDDVAIATQVGLFLPIVENLRAGVL